MQNIPIPTLHLFSLLEKKLMEMLRSLTQDESHKPTIAKSWTVKDVAAHLFSGNMRAISMMKSNYFAHLPRSHNSNEDHTAYLNALNADWVPAMKQVRPPALTTVAAHTTFHEDIACKLLQKAVEEKLSCNLFPLRVMRYWVNARLP